MPTLFFTFIILHSAKSGKQIDGFFQNTIIKVISACMKRRIVFTVSYIVYAKQL